MFSTTVTIHIPAWVLNPNTLVAGYCVMCWVFAAIILRLSAEEERKDPFIVGFFFFAPIAIPFSLFVFVLFIFFFFVTCIACSMYYIASGVWVSPRKIMHV